MHSFIRWAGSKRKQIATLSSFWKPEYKRYIEPFMGSACLFFSLTPTKAILSDINADLVCTFESVRDHPVAISNRLRKLQVSREKYYELRSLNSEKLNKLDAAARFIYLNRYCFNGLYRTNLNGKFNVPYSASKTGGLPDKGKLIAASKLLKASVILKKDFQEVLALTRKGDFVYLDPPFAVKNRRIFQQYGPNSFGLNDIERLAAELHRLDSKGVKFLLSYAYCKEALAYFEKWQRKKILIQRNISGFSRHRRRAGEMLISNC